MWVLDIQIIWLKIDQASLPELATFGEFDSTLVISSLNPMSVN